MLDRRRTLPALALLLGLALLPLVPAPGLAIIADEDPEPYVPPSETDSVTLAAVTTLSPASDSDNVPDTTITVEKLNDDTFRISGSGFVNHGEGLLFNVDIHASSNTYTVNLLAYDPPDSPQPINPAGGNGGVLVTTLDPSGTSFLTDSFQNLRWLNTSSGAANNGSNGQCSAVNFDWNIRNCSASISGVSGGNFRRDVSSKFTNTSFGDPASKSIVLHTSSATTSRFGMGFSFTHRVKGEGRKSFIAEVEVQQPI